MSKGRVRGCDRWHPPKGLTVKLNVNASFFASTTQIGVGMIARNLLGECLAFRSLCRQGLMSVDEGEAWKVSEALKWVVRMNFSDFIVETDAQRVRDALVNPDLDVSVFRDFNALCKRILGKHPQFSVC